MNNRAQRLQQLKKISEGKKSKAVHLRKLAKNFRLEGKDALTKQVLKVLAAETGNTDIKADLSYSYLMRKLRKGDKKKLREFQEAFKSAFDEAVGSGPKDEAETVALMEAMQKIGYE